MIRSQKRKPSKLFAALALISQLSSAHAGQTLSVVGVPLAGTAEVTVRLILPDYSRSTKPTKQARVSSTIWLSPIHGDAHPLTTLPGVYTLNQRDKRFSPHLLVVPIGSVVHFPNHDPFFHNVFSLFNGRRFDLGLYEEGSTRDVTFSREGASYIFCNIHPEMSAVVLALATPLYDVADVVGSQTYLHIHDVAQGTYALHVWVEGENQGALDALTRTVQVLPGHTDLGAITLPAPVQARVPRNNKFDQPYDTIQPATY